MWLKFVRRYSNDFTYRLVQVEPVLLWRRLFGKSANSTDDFTGTFPVANNASDRFACFVEIGYFACQPAQRRIGVGHDARYWLVHLVDNGCRQFSHRSQPTNMSQVGLRFAQGDLLLTQLSLRPFTLGDVSAHPHDFNEVAGFTENGMAYSVKVLDLAVRKNDSELEIGISPFTNCVFAVFKPLPPILRMNSLENRLKWRDTCFLIKSK